MKDDKVNDLELFPLGQVTDVSDLAILFYRFERGENVRILEPQTVAATYKNHIVTDSNGTKHEVPRDWIHIIVKDKNGDKEKVGKPEGDVLVEEKE